MLSPSGRSVGAKKSLKAVFRPQACRLLYVRRSYMPMAVM